MLFTHIPGGFPSERAGIDAMRSIPRLPLLLLLLVFHQFIHPAEATAETAKKTKAAGGGDAAVAAAVVGGQATGKSADRRSGKRM